MEKKRKFINRIIAGCMALLLGLAVLPANVYALTPNIDTPYTFLTMGETQIKKYGYDSDTETILYGFEAPETGKYDIAVSNNGEEWISIELLDEDLTSVATRNTINPTSNYAFENRALKKGQKIYLWIYHTNGCDGLIAAKIDIKLHQTGAAATSTAPKLNKSAVSLASGEKVTLKLNNNKAKVIWVTGDKKIATVNSKGVVTAKKQGTAYIYAIAKHKLYKCKVSVYR